MFEALIKSNEVGRDLLRFLELSIEGFSQKEFKPLARSSGYLVDDPLSIPPVFDQICIAQYAELMGDPRLLHLQDEHQLANTELASEEKGNNTKARRIGQRLENFQQVFHLY
jgi:hypothetical protein